MAFVIVPSYVVISCLFVLGLDKTEAYQDGFIGILGGFEYWALFYLMILSLIAMTSYY